MQIMLIWNDAFFTLIVKGESQIMLFESSESRTLPSRPVASSLNVHVSGITNGRTVKWCGAMAERANAETFGLTIGPPTLNE